MPEPDNHPQPGGIPVWGFVLGLAGLGVVVWAALHITAVVLVTR